ncbi:glycosyltransferase [Glaciihabitans arcticus]|uniref:4,4'-diaponeurosporenoate glycosyltransferase n=1 Tax=Glaciihabitans arcticus TaxID=2668039 RepID=A0A4Q9GQF1_9MICO|nr:glycosyltransferase [Glaciihabitans arcticus]TBN56911.1 glycosyltransferase [Glaciihabitans arcticus]
MRQVTSSVAVVIPARNEEQLVGRCLESVLVAARRVAIPVSITLVADGCTDDTVQIARQYPGVTVVELDASNVGSARRHGVEVACGSASSGVWIANTDADSVVPANWLVEQLRLAHRGIELVIGTVRPDFADLSAEQVAAWTATHVPGFANGHVHGANLGLSARLYEAAGGYPDLPEHEDVDLVARCATLNPVTLATDRCEVMTSGRQYGRTDGGYARYLRADLLAAVQEADSERTVR